MANKYQTAASLVVCPQCGEKKCVGLSVCPEIMAWIERMQKMYNGKT